MKNEPPTRLTPYHILSSEVSGPPLPVLPMSPTPPTSTSLVASASQADKNAAKVVGDVAVDAYDQQALNHQEVLHTYGDDLSAYT